MTGWSSSGLTVRDYCRRHRLTETAAAILGVALARSLAQTVNEVAVLTASGPGPGRLSLP